MQMPLSLYRNPKIIYDNNRYFSKTTKSETLK